MSQCKADGVRSYLRDGGVVFDLKHVLAPATLTGGGGRVVW